MRKLILATLALTLSATAASAADYRRGKRAYRPPPPPPVYSPPPPLVPIRAFYDWSGFYVGANLGGGWANATTDFAFAGGPVFATANNNLSGVLGGAQIGYNLQTGPAVFGVEADYQLSGVRGRLDAPTCPAAVCGVDTSASFTQKMPWFATVRGRLGYAQDSWMIYGTGGYAYARFESEASASAGGISASMSQKENRSGWTAGGGIEVAFSRQWTAKMEYLYMDFGRRDTTWTFAGIPILTTHSRLYENVVRGGINYRF